MSVRKCDRNEGNLQVLNLSLNLAVYTLQICHNEKVFPKSQRWIMTQRIVNECLDAVTCIRRANAVLVQDEQGRAYRHAQQIEAHSHIGALLSLIDLAHRVFGIELRRVEHWTRVAVETDDKLKAWMKSDKERYKE